jgi:hypothetical protein
MSPEYGDSHSSGGCPHGVQEIPARGRSRGLGREYGNCTDALNSRIPRESGDLLRSHRRISRNGGIPRERGDL